MVPAFWYRLFFTRDDDLDMLQIFFLLAIVFFGAAFALEGLGIWRPSEQAWSTFRVVFVILAISGTPVWIANLIAHSKLPGEVLKADAKSHAWPDDGIRPPGVRDEADQ